MILVIASNHSLKEPQLQGCGKMEIQDIVSKNIRMLMTCWPTLGRYYCIQKVFDLLQGVPSGAPSQCSLPEEEKDLCNQIQKRSKRK